MSQNGVCCDNFINFSGDGGMWYLFLKGHEKPLKAFISSGLW